VGVLSNILVSTQAPLPGTVDGIPHGLSESVNKQNKRSNRQSLYFFILNKKNTNYQNIAQSTTLLLHFDISTLVK